MVSGRLEGDPDVWIRDLASPEKAGPDELAFIIGRKVPPGLKAGALLLGETTVSDHPCRIHVREPWAAVSLLMDHFRPQPRMGCGQSAQASIDPDAKVHPTATVGPFCSIAAGAVVSEGCILGPGVHLYSNVHLGPRCLLHAHVVIREGCSLGEGVVVHAGAVIGSEGFGYARDPEGIPRSIPQRGRVLIGDFCEIGANTCIDRATLDTTEIGAHTKLDNLVQIGHNVVVGRGCTLSAQCGISGSVVLGDGIVMGGQVGVADHALIGNRVMVAGQAGLSGRVPEGAVLAGSPAQDLRTWRRNQTVLHQAAELRSRIQTLEALVHRLTEEDS